MNDLFDPSLLNLSGLESDAEFIPLTTAEEEETVNKQDFPENLPILPLRNNLVGAPVFQIAQFRRHTNVEDDQFCTPIPVDGCCGNRRRRATPVRDIFW